MDSSLDMAFESLPSGQELPAGTRLEEFVIERVLGSGGFGITYLAIDSRLGRKVVIKENLPSQFAFRDLSSLAIRSRSSQGEDADCFAWSLENFEKEAAMLASLDHPGIVRVHRSFEAFGTAYFVMPFVEGVALDELIQSRLDGGRWFTEEELRRILEKVLNALDYLHDRGIYHRDIKPGNILITDGGDPVLIDFGAARQRLSERSLTVVESPGYTPFEQLQSRGKIGPWSDLYAFGGTLYKAITGETPAKATDRAFEDPVRSLAGREELQGRYSEVMLRALDRAMCPRLEDRWSSVSDWSKSLGKGEDLDVPDGEPQELLGDHPKEGHSGKASLVYLALFIVISIWIAFHPGFCQPKPLVSVSDKVSVFNSLPPTAVFREEDFESKENRAGLSGVLASDPPGAEVMDSKDGKLLGKTPLELGEIETLKPGSAVWKIVAQGHIPSQIEIEIARGHNNLPVVVLDPIASKLRIVSDPSGAEVLVNGLFVGKTPLVHPVEQRNAKVETRYRSWPPGQQNVTLEPGKEESIEFLFLPVSGLIESEPIGAAVREVGGGGLIGSTPLNLSEVQGLEPGPIQWEISMAGYETRALGELPNLLPGRNDPVRALLTRLIPVHVEELLAANREKPYENSLGLQFIPVPGIPDVWMARTPTRVCDFKVFTDHVEVESLGGAEVPKIQTVGFGLEIKWENSIHSSWADPGFPQGDDHPVVSVSWDEARRFCDWLSGREYGLRYRLPRDAEWTAAVGASKYPWGTTWPPPDNAGRYNPVLLMPPTPSKARKGLFGKLKRAETAPIREVLEIHFTSPVARYSENQSGFYDLGGNVWEYCEDNYRHADNVSDWIADEPWMRNAAFPDGSSAKVLRGGAWSSSKEYQVRTASRARGRSGADGSNPPKSGVRSGDRGFRLVVEIIDDSNDEVGDSQSESGR